MDQLVKYRAPILITVGVSTGIVLLYQTFTRLSVWDNLKQLFGGKKEWVQIGRLGQIWIYPVKALKGKTVSQAHCSKMGLICHQERDRQFIVIDQEDKTVTLKMQPKFALLTPSVDAGILTLQGQNFHRVSVELAKVRQQAKIINIKMWGGGSIAGFECGSPISDWLCDFLEKPKGFYRLLYFQPNLANDRAIANDHMATLEMKKYKNQKPIFANTTPFQLLSKTSLADLNTRLGPDAKSVDPRNFRPNFVIEGVKKPFDEDFWRELRIGDHVTLKTMKPTNRCPSTTIDMDVGVKREDQQPLKTLRKFRLPETEEARKLFNFSPLFGLSLALDSEGDVKVGDPIYAVCQKKKVGIIGL